MPVPLQICHACRSAAEAPACSGPCPCPVDGRDIREHARPDVYHCPRGLFPARGLGDVVAAAVRAVTRAGPCEGCKARRDALNRIVPFQSSSNP